MPLLLATPGKDMTVVRVGGSQQVMRHLLELGFNVGAPVSVVSKVDSGVIVNVRGSRIALDQSMASKIMV